MHKPIALALTLSFALPAAGADTAADARAKTIAPFLDAQTLAVAHLDLTKLDADALASALADLGAAGADGAKEVKEAAGRWLDAFSKAGGKQLYVVFSLDDFPNAPFVIVPLGEGADAGAIAQLLDLPGLPAGPREKVGDAVFAGSAAGRQRLRAQKPAARPELAQAFAAAGDGAAQAAIIPPPHVMRVVGELMPTPDGSGQVLARGVRWAAVRLDAPPKLALRLTIQSQDAAAARALDDTLGKVLKGLAALKEVRAALPDFPKAVAQLEPKIEGDRVVLSLEGEHLRDVIGPLVQRGVMAAARMQAAKSLRQLALGLHRYVDSHHKLPAVANFDKAGKPLLSWRVHILPFIGQEQLYKEFHLDEPWDSEHNKKLLARMPAVFRGPNRKLSDEGKTVYLAPVGQDTAFTGGANGRRFPAEFTDGTSNTILLIQADDAHAVEWTRPEDLKIDLDNPAAGLGRQAGGYVMALADGSVHFVRPTISKETLRAAFTANGGEVLGPDWE